MLSAELSSLWTHVHNYVLSECIARPSDHGAPHAQAVAESSLLIATLEGHAADAPLLRRVLVLALLHDVADHKYDADGSLKKRVETFVRDNAGAFFGSAAIEEGDMCLAAIDAVSFSKENKRGRRWFVTALGGEDAPWLVARDIVSDADKLAAIGIQGIQRCWQYACEMALAAGRAPDARELAEHVQAHAAEKLLLLMDRFIVTCGGKALAAPRHADMVRALEGWAKMPPTSLNAPFVL